MHYGITHSYKLTEPYYLGPGKANPRSVCSQENVHLYSTCDEDTFRKMINDITDSPEYEITEENLTREFWTNREGDIPKKTLDNIIKYYLGRKAVRDGILEFVKKFKESPEHSSAYKKYEFPRDTLGFSMEEPDEYEPVSREEFVEVALEMDHEDEKSS